MDLYSLIDTCITLFFFLVVDVIIFFKIYLINVLFLQKANAVQSTYKKVYFSSIVKGKNGDHYHIHKRSNFSLKNRFKI